MFLSSDQIKDIGTCYFCLCHACKCHFWPISRGNISYRENIAGIDIFPLNLQRGCHADKTIVSNGIWEGGFEYARIWILSGARYLRRSVSKYLILQKPSMQFLYHKIKHLRLPILKHNLRFLRHKWLPVVWNWNCRSFVKKNLHAQFLHFLKNHFM